MKRHQRDHTWAVHAPQQLKEIQNRTWRAASELSVDGRPARPSELAARSSGYAASGEWRLGSASNIDRRPARGQRRAGHRILVTFMLLDVINPSIGWRLGS